MRFRHLTCNLTTLQSNSVISHKESAYVFCTLKWIYEQQQTYVFVVRRRFVLQKHVLDTETQLHSKSVCVCVCMCVSLGLFISVYVYICVCLLVSCAEEWLFSLIWLLRHLSFCLFSSPTINNQRQLASCSSVWLRTAALPGREAQ